jgi:hypothetical protein
MATSWTISVAGRKYGPFDDRQMQAFVGEGRLVRDTLVAREGSADFRAAGTEPELAGLFLPPAPIAPSEKITPRERAAATPAFGRHDENPEKNDCVHYVIVADMKAGSITKLEEEIFALGTAFPIFPQVWLLSSDQSLSAIRNRLIQKLAKQDLLFIADATNDKIAWFNFGALAEASIRKIWAKQPAPALGAVG